jgi:Ni/Fe-hydrogenase subunit HybB-like protein
MSETFIAKGKPRLLGQFVLWVLLIVGVVLTIKRFLFGLGSATNLNDSYPWGFWIGFDILTGIALAAGGFTLTAAIYIWGSKKYHPLARPAILTALLGYIFFVIALFIDLGRGLVMWRMFLPWNWQHESVMFEVGWCVATYSAILVFEFLPSILERFRWQTLMRWWETLTPLVVIALVALFTYAMTSSIRWAGAILGITALFELLQASGAIPRSRPVPILLIMAGVLLSCLHQSSLGSLFLIVPHKLNALWHTPLLPIEFLLSAIMVGPAMVVLEGIVSARVFRRRPELELLSGLARAIPILISIYLVVRVVDVAVRGAVFNAFELNPQAVMFWVELSLGSALPLALLATPEIAHTERGLFWGSLLTVAGVFIHRLNVSVIGIEAHTWQSYSPAVSEYLISLGVVAGGLLAFRYIVVHFPVYETAVSLEAAPQPTGRAWGTQPA